MNSATPKISVIMTAYNAEKYIRPAIESILGQTFEDFEFVIVDDCSSDATNRIIREYASKDARIRLFRNEKNLYISAALNVAICHSRAGILARMDADDIAMPARLEKQYGCLCAHPGIAIVGSDIEIINEEGKSLRMRRYPSADRDIKRKMLRYSPFAHPAVMYRKAAVLEFGGYSEVSAPAEDINLWFKIGSKYEFANIPEALLKYRFFKNSSSNKRLREVEIKTLKIRWTAWKKLGYRPGIVDFAYNLAQAMTIYLMPKQLRLRLFDLVRKIV